MEHKPFRSLSRRGQIARVREIAHQVLLAYPIRDYDLEVIHVAYNAVFRITNRRGKVFMLRLNINQNRNPHALRCEVEWLSALSSETQLSVPVPQVTRAGDLSVSLELPDFDRPVMGVLFNWQPGVVIGERMGRATVSQLGKVMATMHIHGANFTLTEPEVLPKLDNYLWNQDDHLDDIEKYVESSHLSLIRAAKALSQMHCDSLLSKSSNFVIHADMHGYNLLRHKKSIRVIDFDDMAIGSAVQDIAVAAYYHEDSKKFIAALLDGYSEIAEPPQFTSEEMNALLVQRNLVLLNDLFTTASAELAEILPEYAPRTARRMKRYFDTGIFTVAE